MIDFDIAISTGAVCFSTPPGFIDQGVFEQTVFRIVGRARPWREIEVCEAKPCVIAIQWISHRFPFSNKTNAIGSGGSDVTARDMNPAVVTADENAISADLIEEAIVHHTIFGAS